MKHLLSIIVVLALLVCTGLADSSENLIGRVVGVYDGDSLTLLDGANQQYKIRLAGIDAPEKKQAFGTKSKQALSDMVYRETVKVLVTGKDRYGRTLGNVYIENKWVNLAMVRSGMAWHYKFFSSSRELANAQKFAQENRIGLWQDKDHIPPWQFRKNRKWKPK